jgi:hypothetical protein
VWDGVPAPGARTTVRNYVLRLRQVLGPVAGARIVTHQPGYLFRVDDGELDLLQFTDLYRKGSSAVRSGDWPIAAGLLHEAMALWRGAALADVPSQTLQRDEPPRRTPCCRPLSRASPNSPARRETRSAVVSPDTGRHRQFGRIPSRSSHGRQDPGAILAPLALYWSHVAS